MTPPENIVTPVARETRIGLCGFTMAFEDNLPRVDDARRFREILSRREGATHVR